MRTSSFVWGIVMFTIMSIVSAAMNSGSDKGQVQFGLLSSGMLMGLCMIKDIHASVEEVKEKLKDTTEC